MNGAKDFSWLLRVEPKKIVDQRHCSCSMATVSGKTWMNSLPVELINIILDKTDIRTLLACRTVGPLNVILVEFAH